MQTLLSWLLHHANRQYHSPEFYAIKNRLLKKYGKHICYDVQFIEGKECHSCNGTGIYIGTRWSAITWGKFVTYKETCYNCYNGWYKRPVWNILARLQFGYYTFHQPYQRSYTKPDIGIKVIEGYIEHNPSKYSEFAAGILFLIYDRKTFKVWWKEQYRQFKWIFRRLYRKYIDRPVPNECMELYVDDLPF